VLLPPLADWLDVGRSPQPADVVMLLNGGENTRPFVAAALVRGGWARQVLLANTLDSPQVAAGVVLSDGELNGRVMQYCGLNPRQIVLLDGQAESTFDEARALAAYLEHGPSTRVLLVTDGYHTRRARWVFRRVLGIRAEQLSVVSAPTDLFQNQRWWQTDAGFTAVSSEYLKLGLYHLRYGWTGYAVVCGAALLLFMKLLFHCRVARWSNRTEAAVGPTAESGKSVSLP
jgi:uncharacterized SAM-binding protein YcdF (DUF218 family)